MSIRNYNQQTTLINVRELLTDNTIYRIPDYQRGYSWRKEFHDLWNDIVQLYNTIKNTENSEKESRLKHYTGMLVLEEITGEDLKNELINKNFAGYYIVDGQQRITSIIILIQSIKNYLSKFDIDTTNYNQYLKKSNDRYDVTFGYSRLRNDGANEYFYTRIYENNKNNNSPNQYLSNIDNASKYIEDELKRYNPEQTKDILNIILERLVFNLYLVSEDFDVRATFETMNNRGKKLSNLEILKNRLMYLTTFFDDTEKNRLRITINNCWDHIYQNLCTKEEQLDDDEYLKAHWIIYTKLDKKNKNAQIEDILNNVFALNERDEYESNTFYKYIKDQDFFNAYYLLYDYIYDLASYSKYWRAVCKPSEAELGEIEKKDEQIEWLNRFYGLMKSSYVRATLMVILEETSIKSDDKIKFYKAFERFIFIIKYIKNDSNDLSTFVTYANTLRKAKTPTEKQNAFNELYDKTINHDLEKLQINKSNIKNIIKTFGTKINDYASYYYGWKGIKYFLYRYNEYLKAKTDSNTLSWDNLSLEHIFPQTPEYEYWKISFKDYLKNNEEKNKIENSIGNLLLLENNKENIDLSNHSYPIKRNVQVESGGNFSYSSGTRDAQKVAQENEYWTPESVYNRCMYLFDFMYNTWFSAILDKNEWEKLVEENNLIVFDYDKSKNYQEIRQQLKIINIDEEKTSVEENIKNYYKKQSIKTKELKELKKYFNKETLILLKNRVYHLDSSYYLDLKTNNDKISSYRFGSKIELNRIDIYYDYNNNQLFVYNQNLGKKYNNIDEIGNFSQELRTFIESFERYLQFEHNKIPDWLS